MKMFVLIPPERLAQKGAYPLVACDDEAFADRSDVDAEYYTAYITGEGEEVYIDALEVNGKYTDESGWVWIRAYDCNKE